MINDAVRVYALIRVAGSDSSTLGTLLVNNGTLCQKPFFSRPVDDSFDAARHVLGLTRVVVRRPVDTHELLIRRRKRCINDRIVGSRDCVVSLVLDL